MIVTEEKGSRILSEIHSDGFCLREIEFQKMHIQANGHWKVSFEQTYALRLFLITIGKQCQWLNGHQLSSLKALLD